MIYINNTDSLEKFSGVYFWGTGKLAKYVLEQFGKEISEMNIRGFIDNYRDESKDTFFGYQVYSPQILKQEGKYHVIILSNYFEEIVQQIEKNYGSNVCRCENYYYFIRCRLVARYKECRDREIKELLNYIQSEGLQVFNYPFTLNYANITYEINFDIKKQVFYAVIFGKRLYFPKSYESENQIQEYLRQIMMEQDKLSPHCYLEDGFAVDAGMVVVDAGAAEGSFALSVIDRVKKIYLIEPDKDWVAALKYTFEPYGNKVVIINKYLSNYQSGETVTIDSIVSEKLDFLKMDVEGEEYYALDGARNTILCSETIKCVVCTYHQEFDYKNIEDLFTQMGLKTKPSRGYMWFPYDKNYLFSLPTFRRGIIRAERVSNEK